MKSFNQIVEDMKNYIISNMEGENKVTGFHEGSVLLTLIEAFAGELEFIVIDIENDLKKRLIDYVFSYFKFTKLPGQKATIKVKFFCEDEAKRVVTVEAGTKVQDKTGLVFIAKETAYINIGDKETVEVVCEAEEVGTKYNIKDDTELELSTSKIGVDGVTLTDRGKGGADIESDIDYRERFSTKLSGFASSSEPGLQSAVQEIDTLKKIKLHEVDAENTHFTIYAINHSNSLTSDEIKKIKDIVNKNRSCGIRFRVLQPKTIPIEPIHVTITAYDTIQGQSSLKEIIKETIEKKVDELEIGQNWTHLDIVDVLKGIESVYSFRINSAESDKDKKLLAVGDELTCGENQIFVQNKSTEAIVVGFENDSN